MEESFETKVDRALALGKRYLGVENAHLTRIDPQTDYWEAIASTDPPDGRYPAGLEQDLQRSYCQHTLARDDSLALHDVTAQGWADTPAYEAHDLRCYHGTPVTIDQNTYGTLCFVSETPHETPFSESETMFAELIASFLESELERHQFDAELTRRGNLINVLNRVLRHNLRNEMTVVRGHAQLISDQGESVASQYGETIIERADHLIEISEKARKLESVIAEEFDRRERDIVALLRRAVRAVQADYPQAAIDLHIPTDLTLAVRPSIEAGVRELVENAAQHAAPDPDITVSVETAPNEVEIHVEDDGPGLADIEREVLTDGVETPLAHGLGLGLWLVYWIVTSHDGSIEPEVTDTGTRMTVRLPRTTVDPERVEPARQERSVERVHDQFRAVFQDAFDAMVIVGDEGRCIDVNDSVATLVGVEKSALLGRSLGEFTSDDVAAEEHWQECLTGSRRRGTLPLVTADGEERIVEYAVSTDVVPDQHLVVMRDITEREQRQRELELKTRAIEAAPIGISIADASHPDHPLIYTNEAFLDATGYDEEAVIGRNCRFMQGPDTESEPVRRLREGIDAEEPVSVELRNYQPDGTEFWNEVHIAPVTDETGETTHYVGFQQDITNRHERERELRQVTQVLDTVLSNVPVVLWTTDEDGVFTRSRGAGLSQIGLEPGEVVGESLFEVYEDRPEVCSAVKQALEGEHISTTVAHGSVTFETWLHPLRSEAGDVVGSVGLAYDLSQEHLDLPPTSDD